MRRVAVIASASGNGKTTLGRALAARLTGREALWNDNRETLWGAFGGPRSLYGFALRMHFRRRREWPIALAGYPVVRLTTVADVEEWLAAAG